ncbi:MAG: lysophospholipase [Deltaproteobacteria bacterium]|nr:lysophospholipase [Deltaproteobacteria bacterium]
MMSQNISTKEGMFEAADGFQLFERWWVPEGETKAVVVIVHGLAEHSGRYSHVAKRLNEDGYAVYTFDLRLHGRSGGAKAFVKSFDDYLADLDVFLARVREKEPQKPLFLLGHSMGGTISALFAITRKPDIRGLLLSAAALKMGDDISPILISLSGIIGSILPKLPTVKLDSGAISKDPEVIKKYDTDPLNYRGGTPARTGAEIVRATRIIQERMEEINVPILIMHGTADRLANIEGSKELNERARSADKTLKLYEGLYHEILNEPEKEEVMDDIIEWMNSHC